MRAPALPTASSTDWAPKSASAPTSSRPVGGGRRRPDLAEIRGAGSQGLTRLESGDFGPRCSALQVPIYSNLQPKRSDRASRPARNRALPGTAGAPQWGLTPRRRLRPPIWFPSSRHWLGPINELEQRILESTPVIDGSGWSGWSTRRRSTVPSMCATPASSWPGGHQSVPCGLEPSDARDDAAGRAGDDGGDRESAPRPRTCCWCPNSTDSFYLSNLAQRTAHLLPGRAER